MPKIIEQEKELEEFFLDNVREEISTPLNAVVGFNDLLNGVSGAHMAEDEKIVMREHIRRNANRLLTVVNDIIDLSKMQKGCLTLHKTVLLHDFDYRNEIFFSRERRLTQEEIDKITARESLLMLYVTNLEVIVNESARDGHKRFKLNFDCEGIHYSEFAIGDIKVRKLYENKSVGRYKFCDKAIIVFSLTDKFKDGRYYKMAAQFLIWK